MPKQNSPMIGLEIHGYIDTKEKLFCNCKNFHDMKVIKPNTNICPICTGQPGSKPMLPNSSAINKILEIGMMLNCKPNLIENNKPLIFQRKHYSWPDMPHGYQKTISGAYSIPVAEKGKFLGIRITEVHLEEDPAAWNPETGQVDYNRAGAPLVEIVTEPDFKSSEEVENWLRQLVLTLSYVRVLNKDAGIKADVNVNIHGISVRAEIKNVNSITEIVKAIDSEIKRHETEKPQRKETRRWNSETGKTELMRSKEEQEDYRFIPDPDFPAIKITKQRVQEIKERIPESPMEKLDKLIKKYKINKKEAEILTRNLEIVELFEKVAEKITQDIALPWITVEWLGVLNHNKLTTDQVDMNPEHFIELLDLLQKNKITPLKAKDILRKFIPKSFSPKQEAEESQMITDESEIEKIVDEVINHNKKSVDDYRQGEQKAINFLIGQVMQKTNKRADFQTIKRLLEGKLS
ncbi:MAG: Asp-tRNA(Asn)/Glu-tRNA(Gln) amidotransferase subunit GatB [Candidatus Nanoarchaeia archaeon]|nr:Asp-tRNA(Asn)/Glu-tRNA(Gln) amidotransferase subunit GatB [Candidatus Nanoarchaeia archaeon]